MISVRLFFFAAIGLAAYNDLYKHCNATDTEDHPSEINVWEDVDDADWFWNTTYHHEWANGNEVYPVGYRRYVLKEFNEPPVCMHVPGSRDKKVEIMIESDSDNAQICVHDASYLGYEGNDAGAVSTCGVGQFYACFTAATTATTDTSDYDGQPDIDFSFIITCDESCEASDVTLWVRVRLSDGDWSTGKTTVEDDIEMWCEMEKGMPFDDANDADWECDDCAYPDGRYIAWYPSDLIQDEPSVYPFVIEHTTPDSGASLSTPSPVLAGFLSLFAFLCFCF